MKSIARLLPLLLLLCCCFWLKRAQSFLNVKLRPIFGSRAPPKPSRPRINTPPRGRSEFGIEYKLFGTNLLQITAVYEELGRVANSIEIISPGFDYGPLKDPSETCRFLGNSATLDLTSDQRFCVELSAEEITFIAAVDSVPSNIQTINVIRESIPTVAGSDMQATKLTDESLNVSLKQYLVQISRDSVSDVIGELIEGKLELNREYRIVVEMETDNPNLYLNENSECEIQSFINGTLSDRVKVIDGQGNLAEEFRPPLLKNENLSEFQDLEDEDLPLRVSDIKIASVPIPGFIMRPSRDGKFAIECKVRVLDRSIDGEE